MEYIKVSEAAIKWGISPRRVRVLCVEGKIDGVVSNGNLYMIPINAEKPSDGRFTKPSLLDEIEHKRKQLSCLRPLTAGEIDRLREEFMVDFTYNSNAIEGNALTLKETAMVLEGLTIDQKPLKDHLEAVGHRDAFLYVQDVAAKEIPISEIVIKNIHSLVLMNRPEDRGVYRRVPVRILGATSEPVQPYLIEPKMNELLVKNEERKSTMNEIERIARFHIEFENIHPFIDGNGRTGRLIFKLDLIKNGYPPITMKFIDRKSNYDAFDASYRNNSPSDMVDLISMCIIERLDEYLRILR